MNVLGLDFVSAIEKPLEKGHVRNARLLNKYVRPRKIVSTSVKWAVGPL